MSIFYKNSKLIDAQFKKNAQNSEQLRKIALARSPQMEKKDAQVVMNNKGQVYNFTNGNYEAMLKQFGKTKVNGGGLTVGVGINTHNNHKLNAAQMLNLIQNPSGQKVAKSYFNQIEGNVNKALDNVWNAEIKEETIPKAVKVVEEIQQADTESKLMTVAKKVKKMAVAQKVPKYAKAGKYLETASKYMGKLVGKLIYTANGSLKEIFQEDGKLQYKLGKGKRIIHSPKTKKVVKFNEKKMVPVGEVYNAASGTVQRKYLNKNSGKILLKQSNGSQGNTAHFLYKAKLI